MKLKIEIDLENAAFSDGDSGSEAATILRQLAADIDRNDICGTRYRGAFRTLMDSNGNSVGKAKVTR